MLLPLLLTASAAAQEVPIVEETIAEIVPETEIDGGVASYYGNELAGNRTASGERFDPNGMTAAHRSLPFGTRLRVTDPSTGRSVIVRVNDRGPFHKGRILDLSEAAARELGIVRRGRAVVQIALADSAEATTAE